MKDIHGNQLDLFARESPAEYAVANRNANRIETCDRPFHDWYRFVLSYPPHLVREYLQKLEVGPSGTVLDPFCGTGTTLVEAKLQGINSIGIEANPMTYFASAVKVDWDVDPDDLLDHSHKIARAAEHIIASGEKTKAKTLPPEQARLLITNSISPVPLHKSLVLLEQIRQLKDDRFIRHELLAFAKIAVACASNLYFGPEVGVGRTKRKDAPVVLSWLAAVNAMVDDLRTAEPGNSTSVVHRADARHFQDWQIPVELDAVFTSPPYPNEKDYTRTTRLESVLLGFIKNKKDLRDLKQNLMRSNTRNVYKDDDDDAWVANHPEIGRVAREIEKRRIDLNKTSGFERLYSRVTKLYFGGMARHLAGLRPYLKKGARLGYVVGDQASYLRIMIRTGCIIADIAESLGYEVLGIDLFRTRRSTVTGQEMREEVVVLRWPGGSQPERIRDL